MVFICIEDIGDYSFYALFYYTFRLLRLMNIFVILIVDFCFILSEYFLHSEHQ